MIFPRYSVAIVWVSPVAGVRGERTYFTWGRLSPTTPAPASLVTGISGSRAEKDSEELLRVRIPNEAALETDSEKCNFQGSVSVRY